MDTYQGEECEHQADKLVYELNMQQDLARKRVIGSPDLTKMYERVDGREERSV